MPGLPAGTRIGPFEITGLLGAGGMGEVYRARDTRLDRQVAIKVLPDSVAGDPDRLARFDREAKVLAALNHPHIAQVFGLEGSGRTRAIVMELVEGPTLEERIAQGPIPVPETLRLARQIAEALEAAHDLGIVHRDLKPANVKLMLQGARDVRAGRGRPAGRHTPADDEDCSVKVLDFGLAKGVADAPGGDPDTSPTLTAHATGIGTILGTAAYMAPEQARGKAVDKRADVWAFGVVLYEMVTGARLFKGEDMSDTIAAVLRQPIAFTALPDGTPASVRTLIERCLERDPKQRLRDIGEARIALARAGTLPPTQDPVTSAAVPPGRAPSRARALLPWGLLAASLVALAVTLAPGRSSAPDVPPAVNRLQATLGVPGALAVDGGPAAVLSPDGRTLVLSIRQEATTRLYVRHLDRLAPVELAGSDQAVNPFFSPDGSRLGFFASGALKTMAIAGGAATTLTDAPTGRGAFWDLNGDILFQSSLFPNSPLVRITAAGARTDRGTTLAPGDTTHRWPQNLPGGMVLYSSHSDVSNWDNGTLRIERSTGSPGAIVLRGGYHGRYVPTGHLLYVHAGTLYGVRFDLDRLEVTSSPAPIIEHIATTPLSGSAQYSFAANGTLVYVPGNQGSIDGRLHWLDAQGVTSALETTPGTWGNPRFSPDGKQIALQVAYGSHDQIAVYDLDTHRVIQLTSDAANHRAPIWTPDSRHVLYSSDKSGSGSQNIYWRRADGTGSEARLTTSPGQQTTASMHPTGGSILYTENRGGAASTMWLLPLEGSPETQWTPGTPRALSDPAAFETLPAFSPDGRLVAYMSSIQGAFAIYVRPVDGAGGPWRISTGGGAHPVWSRTTRELMFTTEDQLLTAAFQYDGGTFRADPPRPWSAIRYATAGPTRRYDLHPDGTRVVVSGFNTTGETEYDAVVLVTNFFAELDRILP